MSKALNQQVLRFLVVGGIAFLIDYSIYYSLTHIFGVYYLVSSVISFTVSVMFNYILSTKWVFDSQTKNNESKKFVAFIILSVLGLGINQIFLWMFSDIFHINDLISKVIATAIVMVWNFVTRKLIVEKL